MGEKSSLMTFDSVIDTRINFRASVLDHIRIILLCQIWQAGDTFIYMEELLKNLCLICLSGLQRRSKRAEVKTFFNETSTIYIYHFKPAPFCQNLFGALSSGYLKTSSQISAVWFLGAGMLSL